MEQAAWPTEGIRLVSRVRPPGFVPVTAVQVRYPGEAPILEEARSACETARAVRRFAHTLLGLSR